MNYSYIHYGGELLNSKDKKYISLFIDLTNNLVQKLIIKITSNTIMKPDTPENSHESQEFVNKYPLLVTLNYYYNNNTSPDKLLYIVPKPPKYLNSTNGLYYFNYYKKLFDYIIENKKYIIENITSSEFILIPEPDQEGNIKKYKIDINYIVKSFLAILVIPIAQFAFINNKHITQLINDIQILMKDFINESAKLELIYKQDNSNDSKVSNDSNDSNDSNNNIILISIVIISVIVIIIGLLIYYYQFK